MTKAADRLDTRLVVPAAVTWAAAAGGGFIGLRAGLVMSLALALAAAAVAVRRTSTSTVVAVALGCSAAGLAVAAIRAPDVGAGPLPALTATQRTVTAEIRVTGDPRVVQARSRGTARASTLVVVEATTLRLHVDGRVLAVHVPVVVISRDLAWRDLLPSQQVTVAARVTAPRDGDAVAAVLSARGPPTNIGPPSTVQRIAGRLRAGLRESAAWLPREPEGLLPGLVDGDTSGLPEEVREDFRTTGLSHLVAVSGANVAIVAAAALGLARGLGLGLRSRMLVAGFAVVGFVVLARPSPSVLRAALMGVIGLSALATGRRRAGVPALAAAVLALVLLEPSLARSDGFVLSVLATAGLLLIAPALRDRLLPHLPRWLADGTAIAVAAQIMTTPYIALRFDRVSLVSIPANLLATPAVPPATVLGVVAATLAPLCMPIAQVVGFVAGLPAWWLVGVARAGADVPSASIGWPDGWSGAVVLVAVATVSGLALRRPVVRRPLAVVSAASMLAVGGLHLLPKAWPPDGWAMVVCDVGQGDAIVLSAGSGTAVVVDAGPDPTLVDDCLDDLDVRQVPVVVLTHFHADHAEGLPGVLDGRGVAEIAVGPLDDPPEEAVRVRAWAGAADVPLRNAVTGERRSVADISWQVLAPASTFHGTDSDANNSSIVLRVELPGFSALLTGDIEPPAQLALLSSTSLHVDVLKIPHHGSRHQSETFLRAVGARFAVASAGVDNSYGHPADETLDVLRMAGAHTYRTDQDGAVAFLVRKGVLLGVAERGGSRPTRPANDSSSPPSGLSSGATGATARVRGRTWRRQCVVSGTGSAPLPVFSVSCSESSPW